MSIRPKIPGPSSVFKAVSETIIRVKRGTLERNTLAIATSGSGKQGRIVYSPGPKSLFVDLFAVSCRFRARIRSTRSLAELFVFLLEAAIVLEL
jgi:hypothetical protein